MKISIIAAVSSNGVIGDQGKLLWNLPNDMTFFKLITTGHCVIMGRKTYESIPKKYRPLPDRYNIVISRDEDLDYEEGIPNWIADSVENALEKAQEQDGAEIFICGGGEIYKAFLDRADRLYITEVNTVIEGDAKFPEFSADDFKVVWHAFTPQDDKNEHDHHFYLYERKKK